MFYKKPGYPEQDEIVMCTVKKLTYHCVFAQLDEYENKEGMIHISEISPGRIRNIRDYVKEGKQIVCRVLRLSQEKNQIDLSLRRVNLQQKINKTKEFKQELKAEKLLNSLAKDLNIDPKSLYQEVGLKLIEHYGSLSYGLQNIASDESLITGLNINKKIEPTLLRIIKERIKPPEIRLSAIITIQSNAENGIEIIKEILLKIKKDDIEIKYLGAPRYQLTIISDDYKDAEQTLKNISSEFQIVIKEKSCIGKIEKKK